MASFAGTFILTVQATDVDHATVQLEALAKVMRYVPQIESVVLVEGPEPISEGMAAEIESIEAAQKKV